LSLTAKDVAEILKALEGSSFDTLDLEVDGVKVQLRRNGAAPARTSSPHGPQASGAAPVEVPPGTTAVPAPLLGIFYRAPKPGEPPYIEEGAHVEADSIIGIIEVMKLMNTVRAGVRGTVVAIAARNGELVEFGEALLFVKPD
jgi:acetyl-CoA carboxylase biotin carboxyl carrier protein